MPWHKSKLHINVKNDDDDNEKTQTKSLSIGNNICPFNEEQCTKNI